MSQGIYMSGAGMIARQLRQEAIVNNLANTVTPGYKATKVFSEVLDEVNGSTASLRNVSKSQKTYVDFSQGSLRITDRNLDIAIDGPGFFVVDTPGGERLTRNGSFSVDSDGVIVDSQGNPVRADSGFIALEDGEVTIDDRGEVFQNGASVGSLLVKSFADPGKLARRDGGYFAQPDGEPIGSSDVTSIVCQGCLEDSNATPQDAMIQMMTNLREFEASQKILRLQSNVLGRVANELI